MLNFVLALYDSYILEAQKVIKISIWRDAYDWNNLKCLAELNLTKKNKCLFWIFITTKKCVKPFQIYIIDFLLWFYCYFWFISFVQVFLSLVFLFFVLILYSGACFVESFLSVRTIHPYFLLVLIGSPQ